MANQKTATCPQRPIPGYLVHSSNTPKRVLPESRYPDAVGSKEKGRGFPAFLNYDNCPRRFFSRPANSC